LPIADYSPRSEVEWDCGAEICIPKFHYRTLF
jgi:hypothetical protein